MYFTLVKDKHLQYFKIQTLGMNAIDNFTKGNVNNLSMPEISIFTQNQCSWIYLTCALCVIIMSS